MATATKSPPKKKPAKARERKPRPKQQTIADWGPPSIPELDKLCDDWRETRDERMRLNEQENDKRELVRVKMKEHGLTTYSYGDYVVNIDVAEKPVCRKKSAAELVRDRAAKREGGADGAA